MIIILFLYFIIQKIKKIHYFILFTLQWSYLNDIILNWLKKKIKLKVSLDLLHLPIKKKTILKLSKKINDSL